MKLDKLLLIISIVAMSLGGATLIVGTVLSFTEYFKVGDILMAVGAGVGIIAFALMIYRLMKVTDKNGGGYQQNKPRVYVKVVDVKDVPKSREQELYEQYEDLYKKNLITKEDLDKKRVELLGK